MIRILVLVNNINFTSIPFETTLRIARKNNVEMTIASFYDKNLAEMNINRCVCDLPVRLLTLGGDSRLDKSAWDTFRRILKDGYDLVHTHHNFSGSVARVLSH